MGKCPDCNAWNTLVETLESPTAAVAKAVGGAQSFGFATLPPQPLSAVPAQRQARIPVEMAEFNRVLGGGIVPGSVVLLGGDPGIGKSTLLLLVSALLSQRGPVLYVSGEESPEQLKMRADRLGLAIDQLFVLAETQVESILNHVAELKPTCVIVDSIQTMSLDVLESAAGSVSQVRECAMAFQRYAKGTRTPVFLVGHVTKDGTIAGPRVLEHIVDTVLYLEGERFHSYRILRAVKNRFGSTDEIGVFEMRDDGMAEVANPSEVFLAERSRDADGSTVAVTMEGTRPLVVEVQALTAASNLGMARRTANGIDTNRLQLLTAVLQKRVGLALGSQDIFVNVVGGLRITEPAIDLAVATAIASSFRDLAVPADMAIIGEVGLNGELRRVSHVERRLAEAAKLGFKRCLVPKSVVGARAKQAGVELLGAATLAEALVLACGEGLKRERRSEREDGAASRGPRTAVVGRWREDEE
jgi:DNA repair protein RadA/Sms